MPRRAVRRRLEVGIAEPAVATFRQHGLVAGIDELGQHRVLVLGDHLGARRHLDDHVRSVGATPVATHSGLPVLGEEVLLIAVVDKRVEIVDAEHDDVAALATVPTVWPTEFDELLAPERDAAVSARAGAHVDLRLIEKLHVTRTSFASRPVRSASGSRLILECFPGLADPATESAATRSRRRPGRWRGYRDRSEHSDGPFLGEP